jgi:hypothetical protein
MATKMGENWETMRFVGLNWFIWVYLYLLTCIYDHLWVSLKETYKILLDKYVNNYILWTQIRFRLRLIYFLMINMIWF